MSARVASTSRSTRAAGGDSAGHKNKPGHDFSTLGDLERHCGHPWFS